MLQQNLNRVRHASLLHNQSSRIIGERSQGRLVSRRRQEYAPPVSKGAGNIDAPLASFALDPVARKETILDKIIIPGLELTGGDGKGSYAAESHQHNYTRAFGDPERREGLWLLNRDVTANFTLPRAFSQRSYQLKLLALLEQWNNRFADIAILLNGRLLRRGAMLFENVAVGWPANFLDLPAEYLRSGVNTLTFQNHSPIGKREAVFINQVEILIRPKDAAFQFELAPMLIRAGETFQIRIRNTTGKPITQSVQGDFQFLSHAREQNEDVFHFQTATLDNAQAITFRAGGETLIYRPRRIAHAQQPYDLFVGTDFDDDRHDETTLATLDFFHKTQMGNIVGFRPKLGRTCFVIPDQKLFTQWFDFVRSRGLYCWLEDARKRMPWMTPALIRKYPGLIASKYHEICNDIAPLAASLRDLKHAGVEFQKLIDARHEALALPARPFWLSSGTAKVLLLTQSNKVDLPIAEPSTHDHVMLYSAVRKTAALRNKPWGAHIPIQWYLGNAHTEDKLRRFQTSLHLAHLMGAKLIYSESGLFKFVQFQRRDAEHPISQQARTIIRNFYSYTRTQQISPAAKSVSTINLLYGNLDSFFFYQDHVPLDTGRSSNRQLWYKWPFTDLDRGWLAARNLFKPLNASELKGYPGDAGEARYSSNPFGSVDIIPLQDLNKNPLPLTLLLGRNVMTPRAYKTLLRYVKNGGTLFLSLHHFNTNARPDQPPAWLNNGNLKELLGRKLHFTRAPKFITHRVGKGTVICFTGETPMGNPSVRPAVDEMIQSLAARSRPDIHIANDAPVYLQQYDLPNRITQLFLQNINWKFPGHAARADLQLAGKIFPLEVPAGPPTIVYRTPHLAIAADSPLTQIYDLQHSPNRVTFTAAGADLETFTLLQTGPAIRSVTSDGQPLPHSPTASRRDIFRFACDLTGERQITITY